MTAYDVAVTALAGFAKQVAHWGSSNCTPADDWIAGEAAWVVDAILAAVNEQGAPTQVKASERSDDENPHVGWDEPPDDETLDEFVARDVECVHFEALDDCQWYANIFMADGQIWQLNFGSVSGRAKGYANTEQIQ